MNRPVVEILIPANGSFPDEVVFSEIQGRLKLPELSPADRKRLLVVAMELFLNIRNHADHHHLALIRINTVNGGFMVSSMNFARNPDSRRLSDKHQMLSGINDYRKNFRDRLQRKLVTPEPTGNLGLDICFRNCTSSSLHIFPARDNLQLIHLSFSLHPNGKAAA